MSDTNLQRAPQWDADPIVYSENQATSPGEETSQKPKIKPRRHAIACISCRKRKMRCDGTQPRCNACVVRSVPCEYKTIDRRAGTKKGYIAVLGSKLRELGAQLKEGESSQQQPQQQHDGAASNTGDVVSDWAPIQSPGSNAAHGQEVAREASSDASISPPAGPRFGGHNSYSMHYSLCLPAAVPPVVASGHPRWGAGPPQSASFPLQAGYGGAGALPSVEMESSTLPLSGFGPGDGYNTRGDMTQTSGVHRDPAFGRVQPTLTQPAAPVRSEASSDTALSPSTSWSEASDIDDDIDDDATAPVVLTAPQRHVVSRVMRHFLSVLDSMVPEYRTTTQGYGAQQGRSGPGFNATQHGRIGDPTRSLQSLKPKGKRPADRDDDEDDEDDEDDSHRDKRLTGAPDEPSRRLACHFFKRTPLKYREERSCVGPGWRTVHRIKEHLYRCHMLPVHCFRCQETFDNDEQLQTHMRTDPPCQVRSRPRTMEGINPSQEKLLRSRKRAQRHMTEVEKWKDVYTILFPADDPAEMPSPYYEIEVPSRAAESDNAEFARYEAFLRQELPSRVRQSLEARVQALLAPPEAHLRDHLVDIVHEVQLQLFEAYKRSRGTGMDGPPRETSLAGLSSAEPTPSASSGVTDPPSDDYLSGSEQQQFEAAQCLVEERFAGFDGLLFNFSRAPPADPDWSPAAAYAPLMFASKPGAEMDLYGDGRANFSFGY